MENDNYKLCFVKYIGQDDEDKFIYDLLFTENDDTFWGEGFEIIPSCMCNDMIPNDDSYEAIKRIKTKYKLSLVQESCCTSMQDCMDGIISLCWCYDDDDNFLFKIDYATPFNEIIDIINNM